MVNHSLDVYRSDLTFSVDPNCTTACGSTGITAIVCKLDLVVNKYDLPVRLQIFDNIWK